MDKWVQDKRHYPISALQSQNEPWKLSYASRKGWRCTEDSYYQKTQKITSAGKDMEKLEPLCTAGGNVKWCSHCRKQYGNSSKKKKTTTKIELPYYPACIFLSKPLWEMGSIMILVFKNFYCVETLLYTEHSKAKFIIYYVCPEYKGKPFSKCTKDRVPLISESIESLSYCYSPKF